MWQRRVLAPNLGSADALVQLSLPLLKRYAASQPKNPPPIVTIPQGYSTPKRWLTGVTWAFTSEHRNVSVASIELDSMTTTPSGQAALVWTLLLNIAEVSQTAFGKTLSGGVPIGSALDELWQQYDGIYGRNTPGLGMDGRGLDIPVLSSSSASNWTAGAQLTTPISTGSGAIDGQIKIAYDIQSAKLDALTTANGSTGALPSLKGNLATRIVELCTGQLPDVFMPLSFVGPASGAQIPELTPIQSTLRVSGLGPSALLNIYGSFHGPIALPVATDDLAANSDMAYLAREEVLAKTVQFCFRTGEFPLHWRNVLTQEDTNNAGPVTISSSLDVESANIECKAFQQADSVKEDRVYLNLVLAATIVGGTLADGTEASQELLNTVQAPQKIINSVPIFLSGVGAPPPIPDPQVNAFFQSLRTKVTYRFSLPTSHWQSYTLVERSLNGNEKVLLSRLNLIL